MQQNADSADKGNSLEIGYQIGTPDSLQDEHSLDRPAYLQDGAKELTWFVTLLVHA